MAQERAILHCDMNCFYASCEMAYHPELQGKPIAVCGDPERRSGIVLTASYPAKRMGVKTGMPLWEAQQHCRDIIFVPAHYDLYTRFSGYTREIFLRFTDQVEPFGLDEAWLDCTGSRMMYGDGLTIAKKISDTIKDELGMRDAYKPLGAPSTIIYVEMDKSTASTMLTQNGSCAPSRVSSLNVLRRSIAEHFGVKYRNYLKPDDSGAAPARILIPDYQMANGKTCDVFVKPIFQRYKAVTGTHHLSVNYNGHDIPVSVEVGLLNVAATQTRAVTGGYALKHYYQGNMSTQGVDIQLGDRVIATAQLDTIWDRARHPSFNLFTGTIAIDISDLPRGFLNTLANKSNIDLSDEGWRAIFDAVKDAVPVVEDKTCPLEEYAKQFAERIMNNTGNKVELQFPVYANRTRIDVLEYIDENHCNIYDFMSTAANMKSVAELRTHWDGMVSQGCQPVSATMFTTSRGPMLSHTCEELNSLIQSMPDDKMKAALKVAKGDVAKLPHYNLEIVVDKNLPR